MRQRIKWCSIKRNICHFLLRGMISISQIQNKDFIDSLSYFSPLIHEKENRGDLKRGLTCVLFFPPCSFSERALSFIFITEKWKMSAVIYISLVSRFYRCSIYFPIHFSNIINFLNFNSLQRGEKRLQTSTLAV